MAQIHDYPGLEDGQTAWWNFNEDGVIIQQKCPDCDNGLLYSPARFCGRCSGHGLIIVARMPAPTPNALTRKNDHGSDPGS